MGVPAKYGGFETLAENLVKYHHEHDDLRDMIALTVYCSGTSYTIASATYLSAGLQYIPLNANGAQSIPYDIWSLLSAVWNRVDVILLLGTSGAVALPFVRIVSNAKIITNIDGIEWKRLKWTLLAKLFLRFSERVAVRFSHQVIADNAAIADYLAHEYDAPCKMIAYGGDHASAAAVTTAGDYNLPSSFAVSVCRIEPENNIQLIAEAFSRQQELTLVVVGNWRSSAYGLDLIERYSHAKHLVFLDPIYDLGKLKALRSGAVMYVHGHSAGGTNPSLVEAMHFGLPVLAFDCSFNRHTTENVAIYFKDANELVEQLNNLRWAETDSHGARMLDIARRRYTWEIVAKSYFELFCEVSSSKH